ncbi:MAG: hypothetical protein JKY51_04995 [Opitutaceae bacterium]|nr:hypothetical protein [Opitutaceae bacterium]
MNNNWGYVMKTLTLSISTALIITASTSVLAAKDLTIYVAPKNTPANEYATTLAQTDGSTVERKIHKAFIAASSHLTSCGSCTVSIKLAHGEYEGKAKAGLWIFPDTIAPKANLKILGGWNDNFSERDPFVTQTILKVSPNRSSNVLTFEGKKHALKTLVLSGLTIDTTPSNSYDRKTNSMTKFGSSTFDQLAFGYLTTEKLTIADNTFVAAAEGVGGPLIRVAGSNPELILENNIFFNNIHTWVVASPSSNKMLKKYHVKGNSFILNWPYNPDRTTSNPGTLEIGNKYSAEHIVIEDNLFAYNYGGAIFPQWDDTKGPKISINNNLFYGNGMMFGTNDLSSGAVVGKFAGSGTHSVFSAEDLEDDFNWDVSGNVSFDPDLGLGVPKTKSITGTGERSEAQAEYGEETQEDAPLEEDAVVAEETSSEDEGLSELEGLMAGLEEGADSEDVTEDSIVDDSSVEEEEDDNSVISGLDLALSLDTGGDGYSISGYAPKVNLKDGLPFPKNPEAQNYGASSLRVKKY